MTKLFIGSVISLAFCLAIVGCKKSDAPGNAESANAAPSPLEREAQAAAMAELQRHWTKGPDGWTTERISGTPDLPDHVLRQFREISVESVAADEVTPSDKLNGTEWSGIVNFKQLPYREAGDPGLMLDGMMGLSANRIKGSWTPWVEYQPEHIRLEKTKGQWRINQDTWLLRGTIPTPADYTRAGVK